MAITYGTRTALANVSRVHSATNTQAFAFGEIDNSAGAAAHNIHIAIPINALANSGAYDLYLVESQNGTEWTDNIDPTDTTVDVAGKLSDARFLKSVPTVHNATDRTEAEFHVTVSGVSTAAYFGFVLANNSGQTIPASGAAGNSVSVSIS